MIKRVIFIGMIFVSLVMFGVSLAETNYGGVASIESTFDYKSSTSEDDVSVDQAYLAGWYGNDDGYFYVRSEAFQVDFIDANGDTTNYESQRLEVDELYGKFHLIHESLDWKIGKALIPFGFEYLSRPNTSVFITSPRQDFYAMGLHLEYKYGIIGFQGSYLGDEQYSAKVRLSFLDGMDKLAFAITNIDDVEDSYGSYSITNAFKYASTFFDASLLAEYTPDNDDFWTRLVIAPGVFDSVGLFGGYYHVQEMHNTLHDFSGDPDIWSYGAFVDVSPNMTVSAEWMNSLVLNPVTLEITIKF